MHRSAAVVLSALALIGPTAWAAGDAMRLAALREEARTYEHGEGVPRDGARAATLYCEAAAGGDAEAQYSLGWMYANGRGVARDDEAAAYFFALAARQGHGHAQRMQRYVGEPPRQAPECMTGILAAYALATPEQRKQIDLIRRLAPEYGVSPGLALAVARAESGLNPVAVSARNAQGLMQLIPETAIRFNVKKPFDPEQSVRGGLAYLRWLLAYYEGNVALALAAYNAGEGAVDRHRGIPPYAETRDYVARIMRTFRRDTHPFDPAVVAPSPELARCVVRKTW